MNLKTFSAKNFKNNNEKIFLLIVVTTTTPFLDKSFFIQLIKYLLFKTCSNTSDIQIRLYFE